MNNSWLIGALIAVATLYEVELRWVEQALPPAGRLDSLSTAGAPGGLSTREPAARPLGPVLRVVEGGKAVWSLQLPARSLWLQGPRTSQGQGLLTVTEDAAWQFEARPYRNARGGLQLQLHWQQPATATGGSQQWQSELPLAEGLWTTVARSAPPTAPPDGTLRTEPVGAVQELQVRVRRVPE